MNDRPRSGTKRKALIRPNTPPTIQRAKGMSATPRCQRWSVGTTALTVRVNQDANGHICAPHASRDNLSSLVREERTRNDAT